MHLRKLVGRQGRGKLPGLAPHGVITEAAGELALGPVHLTVQVIALHVTDDLAIQVQLVQVAAAVVQVIDLTPIRQGQRGQVAEWVVLVAERAVRGDFFGQTAEQIVGVFQLLFCDPKLLADPGRLPLDAQQPVTVVVCECLARITVDLGNQTPNGITLEQRMALGPLGIFAIANLIQSCEMATDVVAETPGQVIHPHFFAQPVRSVVGKAARGVVFVDQCGQALRFVMLVANPLALGVLAAVHANYTATVRSGPCIYVKEIAVLHNH